MTIFELRAKLFSPHRMTLLLERMTDKPWLFRLGYSADILSEMNKMSLSLQGKQLTVFVADNKNRAFEQKLEFWKICICLCELDSFPILNSFFFDKTGMILMNVIC